MRSFFQILSIVFLICGIASFVSVFWNGLEGALWGITLTPISVLVWMLGVLIFYPKVEEQVPAE